MKNPLSALAISFVILFHPVISLADQEGRQATQVVTETYLDELSAIEIDNLVFMREEEKLARDVYLTFFERWGLPIFENIAASEQSHTNAVANMLDYYKLSDPVVNDTIGVFVNEELSQLYDFLVSENNDMDVDGDVDVMDALYVGALIEEVDMEDIQHAIDVTDNENIVDMYNSLLCGSRNHLRAYVDRIEDQGIVYQAQVLDQEEVDAIVNSDIERGGDCR
jgi:hypothetical protein